MDFMYLDESGDCGAEGSKHLVLTLVCTKKKKKLEKAIVAIKKEVLSNNKCKKWFNRNGGEIKYYGFPNKEILKRSYKRLSQIPMHIRAFVIQKNKKKIRQNEKAIIMGQLFYHIMEVDDGEVPSKIFADLNFFNCEKVNYFIVDEYETKTFEEDGKKQREVQVTVNKIDEKEYTKLKKAGNKNIVAIHHHRSRLMESLQATDLISGAIFHSFEHKDDSLIKIIESKNKAKISVAGLSKKK